MWSIGNEKVQTKKISSKFKITIRQLTRWSPINGIPTFYSYRLYVRISYYISGSEVTVHCTKIEFIFFSINNKQKKETFIGMSLNMRVRRRARARAKKKAMQTILMARVFPRQFFESHWSKRTIWISNGIYECYMSIWRDVCDTCKSNGVHWSKHHYHPDVTFSKSIAIIRAIYSFDMYAMISHPLRDVCHSMRLCVTWNV